MSHTCPACLVTCMDFRLHRRGDGRNFLSEVLAVPATDCDIVTRAGAVQDLLRGPAGAGEALLRDLKVAAELHHVRTIYLMNHTDCGAYSRFQFAGPEEELDRHQRDLREAADIVHKHLPGIQVKLLLAVLEGGGDYYSVKEVSSE